MEKQDTKRGLSLVSYQPGIWFGLSGFEPALRLVQRRAIARSVCINAVNKRFKRDADGSNRLCLGHHDSLKCPVSNTQGKRRLQKKGR